VKEAFHKLAQKCSNVIGSPWSFCLALAIILLWAVSGPYFGFSDTWQLIVNTGTTVVTFLIVFLIQNTQNRDAKVIQLKLDELIRANQKARNSLVDLEDLSDEEIERLEKEFGRIKDAILDKRKRERKPARRRGEAHRKDSRDESGK
jgi:low affinity Fe/Cu permease